MNLEQGQVLCSVCLKKINDKLASYWTTSTADPAPAVDAGTAPVEDEAATV